MKHFIATATVLMICGAAAEAFAQSSLTSVPPTGDTNAIFTFVAEDDFFGVPTDLSCDFSIDTVLVASVTGAPSSTDPNGVVCSYTATGPFSAGNHAIHVDFIYQHRFTFTIANYSLFVSQAITATSTGLAISGGAAYGSEADLTATVDGGTSPPSGLVLFTDGAIVIGVGSLIAGTGTASTALFSTSTLAPGTHSLNAVYLGNSKFGGSQPAAPVSLIVAQATPTVAVSLSTIDAPYLDPVGVSVTVTYPLGGVDTPAPGVVTFIADPGFGQPLIALGGPISLDSVGHAAITIAPPLVPASYTIIASYNGTTNIAAGGGSQSLQIDSADTATSLVISSTAVAAGTPVTLTASVVTTDGVPLTSGNVVFLNASDASVITIVPVNASGIAQLTVTPPPGTNGYFAIYQTNIVGAVAVAVTSQSVSVSVVVGDSPTNLRITANEATGLVGDDIALTIGLSANSGVGPLTGTLVLREDGRDVGELDVPSDGVIENDGSLQFLADVTVATAGVHVFEVDLIDVSSGYVPTSSAVFVSLLKAASTVFVGTAPATDYGTPITVIAVVDGDFTRPAVAQPAGRRPISPTGTVQFAIDGVPFGAPQAVSVSSTATFTFNLLPTGTHQITATYLGDDNFTGSSVTDERDVTQIGSLTRVTSANAPVAVGQGALFTATVSASGGIGVPSGSVTFFADGGTTPLGSATLDATGVALFTTNALAVGAHSIVAIYSGDIDFTASISTALTQNVTTAGSVLSLSADPAFVAFGTTTTLAAHVATETVATGSVTFADNGASIGTASLDNAGNAQLTTAATLAVGSHLMSATYAGDSTHQAASAQLSVVVYASSTAPPQAQPLVTTTTLAAGDTHCPSGGVRVDIGLDNGDGNGTAKDGVLQNGEVTGSSYVCSPPPAAPATVQLAGGAAKGCRATGASTPWLVALVFVLARKRRTRRL